ncbi:energy-coupling factor ABC transporter ATP-binding protein [Anaeroselena agilis]|uniref:ABC transporter ATP-binding protein n=1 Tax=Anaeroselena agilis TaxID=3063788 RepID=A0ABU3P227_9FIRM|nr:ABC transporter ATP-binding protein [Selenomonadales bacterium 4137-cl]
MLEIENVSYCYKAGRYAVRDASLKVGEGEFVAIAGRNGSGKTTLTRLVMGLLRPAAGKIMLDGRETAGSATAVIARQVGYVFQNPDRQIFRDAVAEEVAYGPEQLGFSAGEVREAVAAALEATGLAALAAAYPRTLSKGQKQRLAIASALALSPRLLILDEPTSGQDAREKTALMELLTGLNAKGMAILLVTHDMELLARYAHRAVVMTAGRVVFDGGVRELFAGEADVSAWGLREPAAAKVARGLKDHGVMSGSVVPEELCGEICATRRRLYA